MDGLEIAKIISYFYDDYAYKNCGTNFFLNSLTRMLMNEEHELHKINENRMEILHSLVSDIINSINTKDYGKLLMLRDSGKLDFNISAYYITVDDDVDEDTIPEKYIYYDKTASEFLRGKHHGSSGYGIIDGIEFNLYKATVYKILRGKQCDIDGIVPFVQFLLSHDFIDRNNIKLIMNLVHMIFGMVRNTRDRDTRTEIINKVSKCIIQMFKLFNLNLIREHENGTEELPMERWSTGHILINENIVMLLTPETYIGWLELVEFLSSEVNIKFTTETKRQIMCEIISCNSYGKLLSDILNNSQLGFGMDFISREFNIIVILLIIYNKDNNEEYQEFQDSVANSIKIIVSHSGNIKMHFLDYDEELEDYDFNFANGRNQDIDVSLEDEQMEIKIGYRIPTKTKECTIIKFLNRYINYLNVKIECELNESDLREMNIIREKVVNLRSELEWIIEVKD